MRPYGFERDRLTVRKDEAAVLREAARRVVDGEPMRSVARWLNETGKRTSTGADWNASGLRRLLTSNRVAGLTAAGEPANWPAILPQDLREKVVEIVARNRRTDPTHDPTQRAYLLTGGLATCALCGHALVARPNASGNRAYVCSSAAPHKGCGKIRITAEPFEQDVSERVVARLVDPRNRRALAYALRRIEREAEVANEDSDRLRARLDELGREYADGNVGRDELVAASRRIRDRLRSNQVLLDRWKATEDLPDDVEEAVGWWRFANTERRRTLIAALAEEITVGPALVRGSKKYDAGRVRVNWR